MEKKNTPKGIIFLVTAAVVWGFAFVAQRLGADHVGAFTFNGARFLLGTLSLIPVILLFEKNEYFYDGGMSDNYPKWCFTNGIALKVSEEKKYQGIFRKKIFGEINNYNLR